VFRAQLEKRRAAIQKSGGKIEDAAAGARGGVVVEDGVQPGKNRGSGLGARSRGSGARR
jgi:hypothetical protein